MSAAMDVDSRLAASFHELGWSTFDEFFNHAGGEIISGHPSRNVARFRLGTWCGYLKREHQVYWKDYFQSWWAGFGFVSKSRREWNVLRALRGQGIMCPEPLAVGEKRGQAFLLVRELPDMVDLHEYLKGRFCEHPRGRHSLAVAVGRAIARFHGAGFTHPDLYAKHVFVQVSTRAIALIDFQRTCYRRTVSWRDRFRDLAALHASLGEDTVSTSERLLCLAAYLHEADPRTGLNQWRPALRAIADRAEHLMRRRKIRAMREGRPLTNATSHVEYLRVALDPELNEPMDVTMLGSRGV